MMVTYVRAPYNQSFTSDMVMKVGTLIGGAGEFACGQQDCEEQRVSVLWGRPVSLLAPTGGEGRRRATF
ncbi:hypothetical protein N4G70_12315 [Streptomyces sp. ASQP_92]|uniref:hypothetical protein n=1 Tax=Streptomyces sp. ASQP_92 TaxID=2979116 RepID=UPI0021BFE715|nr:hypothetical protein [Streptomyces sp. ASQP_92]MCT9089656.1 hypothetical protein [Streptomyces sp. ASQP_92]